MPDYSIVVVEPKFQGNIGAIARTMMNFGVVDLRLVNPPELGWEAKQRSMHAEEILEKAKIFDTLEEALKDCSYAVGTSGATTSKEKSFVRINLMPWELAEKVGDADGRVALVFGREDVGLYNEELNLCEALVNIPTDPMYPVMNLSHAVAVLLYELRRDTGKNTNPRIRLASGEERELLFTFFDEMLEDSRYAPHKREKTSIMFRRILGRAVLTKWEFHTLTGVLRDASIRIRTLEGREIRPEKKDWAEPEYQDPDLEAGDE